MKEYPILFSPLMAAAIRDGRKSQTRRVMKPQPEIDVPDDRIAWTAWDTEWSTHDANDPDPHVVDEWTCPYGKPGDRLRFLTTWSVPADFNFTKPLDLPANVSIWTPFAGPRPAEKCDFCGGTGLHAASIGFTGEKCGACKGRGEEFGKLRPGRFAPNHLRPQFPSGINRSVRVEGLKAITELDAIAEGFSPWTHRTEGSITARRQFFEVWETLNAKRGYPVESDPWVWVVGFEKEPTNAEA